MLQLRVREYSATGEKGRILPHVEGSLNWTASENGSPVLEFSLTDTVADRRPDDGFAVGVEYSVDGGRFQSIPYHDRFIMNQNDGDDTDPTKTVKFSGESLALWKLARTYVHWARNAVDKIRKVTSLPNGHFDYFFKESKARGWGTDITFPYTYGQDSSGATWPAADAVELEWTLGTPLTDVLTTLTDGGLCDWTVVGTEFKMYRPGTLGVDRSELLLSSAQVERAPIKADVSGLISHISVMSDSGNWQYLSTPETKWGRLEATMSMSGVGDYAVASKMAQPALDEGSKAKREEAYEWDSATLSLVPFRDFNIGDTITVDVRGARSPRKVIGFVLGQEGVSTTVRAILGESISSSQKKILERVTSATVGGIIGGTGNGFPASVGPSPLAPAKPNGLVVTSNVGEWLGDGSALATVGLSWPDVTEAVDGSEATISHYEILSRLPSETLSLTTTTHDNNVYIDRWAPGIPRLVAVVAVATNGQRSEPSLEVEVIPQMPSSVVPKAPTGLVEVSNTGEFTSNGPVATVVLSWSAVTESTDDEPITIDGYEVFADGVPVARVTGTSATVKLTSAAEVPYSVRAISDTGVAGDPSTALNVTGANPALVTRVPTTPTLTTGYGNVFARWDGSYASGGTVGAHSVRVEARVGSSGSWAVQGTLIAAGEQIISAGVVGETVQVRLIAIDQLSRVTGTSATASTVREGIDFESFDDLVRDRIEGIENDQIVIGRTVDGLNRTFTSAVSPGRGFIGHHNLFTNPRLVGDGTWAEVARWNTGDPIPVVVQPEDFRVRDLGTGESVMEIERVSGLFEVNCIAGVSTRNGKPAVRLIPIGAPPTGAYFMSSDPVTASSVTGVGAVSLDAPLQEPLGAMVLTLSTGDGYASAPNLAGDHPLRVNGGVTPGGHPIITLVSGASAGNGDVWWTDIGLFAGTLPEDAEPFHNGDVWYRLEEHDGTMVHAETLVWDGQDWVAYALWLDSLAATNSVTARLIKADEAFFTKVFTNTLMAGRVETDHLSSNVGETLNITSNESVQIMVTQQEQLSSDVSAAQAAAENAQGLATDASIAAGEAIGAAQTANNNAANAQSTAEQAAANIAAQQAVFVVTPTGADVRSIDTTSIVRIVPTGISIVQNSTDVSSWSGSQFNVGQIVVRDVGLTQGRIELMGNHAIERNGTRTVFKKL